MALNLEIDTDPTLSRIKASVLPENASSENTTNVLQRDLEDLEYWKKQTYELEQTDMHAVLFLQATRETLKKRGKNFLLVSAMI